MSEIKLDTAQILAKVEELDNKMAQINRNRIVSAVISIVGIVLVVAALALFAFNFVSFIRTYDKEALIYQLRDRTLAMASGPDSKHLLEVIQDKLIPAYASALVDKFESSTPLFVRDFENIQQDIIAYLEYKMKPELLNNIVDKLYKSEAAALADYMTRDESREKVIKVLEASHQRLVEKLPDVLNNRIDPAIIHLNALHNSFNGVFSDMEKSGEFTGITKDMSGEIENRLIENILEIAIYQINPEKGRKPANQ